MQHDDMTVSHPIRINLLDWRETERQQRQRSFISALGVTVLACLCIIAFMTLQFYGQRIETQRQRNAYLQQQISIADSKKAAIKQLDAKRAVITRKIHVIERLRQSRSRVAHYLKQISSTLPDGLVLTHLKQMQGKTTLKGSATSNAQVFDYMMELGASPYLDDPKLIVSKASIAGKLHRIHFVIEVGETRLLNAPRAPAR